MKIKYDRLCLLITAAATLLITSCEKTGPIDVSSFNYILFSSPQMKVETLTKSTLVENELPEGTSFGVMGYCVPYTNMTTNPDWASGGSMWDTKRPNAYPDVFDNMRVIYLNAEQGCTYNNGVLKKWYNAEDNENAVNPDDYRYTFFAYYPYREENPYFAVSSEDGDGKGAPIFTFTMPFQGTNTEDFLDDAETPDAMLALNYNVLRSGGSVNFNFSHIMVGLGFSLSNYNFAETDVVTVNSIKLKGSFVKSLSVNFNKPTNDPDFYNYSGRYNGYFNVVDSPVEIGPGEMVEPGKHLLLLSDIKGNYFGEVGLEINYTYNGKSVTVEAGRPTDFKPQPGVVYTAQVSFVGDTFVLNFVARQDDVWENGGDSDITIQ